MFYHFRQNNSGGTFDVDPKRGIDVNVIIEADNYHEANSRAENIGLYFDGQGDCSCCGDRWYEMYDEDDAREFPHTYGEDITIPVDRVGLDYSTKGFIHYKDSIQPFQLASVKKKKS